MMEQKRMILIGNYVFVVACGDITDGAQSTPIFLYQFNSINYSNQSVVLS